MQQRAYLFLGKLISREVFSGSKKKNKQTKKPSKESSDVFFFGSISQNHHITNYKYK